MKTTKEPVLLATLIDTSRMRWLTAGIGFDNQVFPLLTSEDNDLAEYQTLEFDEQASFLRHRFCGVLQRGCDRLWGLKKKACHFVFLIDDYFPDAPRELTDRIAEHLAQWMTNPPVVFFSAQGGLFDSPQSNVTILAGDVPADRLVVFEENLPQLLAAAEQPERWESVPPPKPRAT